MSNLHQCPYCGADVDPDETICPYCDHAFEPGDPAPEAGTALDDTAEITPIETAQAVESQPAGDLADFAAQFALDDIPSPEANAAATAAARARANLPTDIVDPVIAGSSDDALPDDTSLGDAPPDDASLDDAPLGDAAVEDDVKDHGPEEIAASVPPDSMPEQGESAWEELAADEIDWDEPTGPGDILPPPPAPMPAVPTPVEAESGLTISGSTPRHTPAQPAPAVKAAAVKESAGQEPGALPTAPYTPPPALIQPPTYAYPPAVQPVSYQPAMPSIEAAGLAFLQQRVQTYLYGGYRLISHGPREASLAHGKGLSVGTWLLALISLIGVAWYLLMLAVSGLKPDVAYLTLEPDGRVYEDGPGAAHVRAARSRGGRRWALFGMLMVVIGGALLLALGAVAMVTLSQDRYQAALREAYPAVELFEERLDDSPASEADVDLAKTASVVFVVLGGIGVVALWGGATLFVIGTVHASAYRTVVPPLPEIGA